MNATIARRFRGASAGYLLIAPAVIVTVVFLLIPMVVSGYWSLTHYNGIRAPEFVGLQNYADVLSNARFQRAFQNTVFFVIMGMSIGPVLGLGSALLLNDNLRLRALFRTAFFLPTMTSLIVVATIWKFMYADNGIINAVAGFFGLPGPRWLNDPTTALPAVVGDGDLAGVRVRDRRVPGRPAGDSRGSTTKRPARRRRGPLGTVAPGHAARPPPDDRVRLRHRDHRQLPGLRPGLRDDATAGQSSATRTIVFDLGRPVRTSSSIGGGVGGGLRPAGDPGHRYSATIQDSSGGEQEAVAPTEASGMLASKFARAQAHRRPRGSAGRVRRLRLTSILMLAPFFWTLSSSFKLPGDVFAYPPKFVPGSVDDLENYRIVVDNRIRSGDTSSTASIVTGTIVI